MLFILAGHETTASTLQFFWYLICMNPDVQDQIYEEIKLKENFNYEDIRDFKGVPIVFLNSLRFR